MKLTFEVLNYLREVKPELIFYETNFLQISAFEYQIDHVYFLTYYRSILNKEIYLSFKFLEEKKVTGFKFHIFKIN